MQQNPLLVKSTLPAFDHIQPEHMLPALNQVLAENRKALLEILNTELGRINWDKIIVPLDELNDQLDRVWSPIRHLNSVMDNAETRQAYDLCLAAITNYQTELGQNQQLQRLILELRSSADGNGHLDHAQIKALDDALLGFKLNGVALPETEKARFKEIQEQLSALNSAFEKNVLDATLAWHYTSQSPDTLKGLPESAMQMAQQAAHAREQSGYLLSLQAPSYIAAMTYLDNRELRQAVYTAYNTRASDQGPHAGQWDNSQNIEQILKLRHKGAQLLGFANYAEQSLATKMAGNPQQVLDFLYELAAKAKLSAEQELAELRVFADQHLAGDKLQAWDMAYFAEKLKQEQFAISQEELKPWFPAPVVLRGLFTIVQRLFGITITAVDSDARWHADVQLFEIHDEQHRLRGRFYLDLYARDNKRGGAWMDECHSRFRRNEAVQIPVAFLTCNLTPPVGDKPALFTHNDVITLFHEFGHGLHHMLTRVDYPSIAGIRGVEWDAVELPSQFLENWCWESEALQLISSHYQTNQPLPAAKIAKLRAAKNFHAAMQLLRQIEFSVFDLRLHLEYDPAQGSKHKALLEDVRKEVSVFRPPEFVRMQHGFSHIFAGGYAAGYYSYKWAEVLSADAFDRFKQQGIFNPLVGRDFLHYILEKGGSEKALDLFVRFRGREPSVDALLRDSGLAV